LDRHPDQQRTALRREMRKRPTMDEADKQQTSLHPPCSSVIRHLDEFDPTKLLVVLYMRESSDKQESHNNLRNRRKLAKRTLKQRGIEVICSYSEVVSGNQLHNRPGLWKAIRHARLLKWGNPDAVVIVITDARNRFLRGPNYDKRAKTDPPNAEQLRILKKLAKGVILATILDPDATFEEVRRYETNVPTALGAKSGKKVGRPKKLPTMVQPPGWKKNIRLQKIDQVLRLRDQDVSNREIGRRLDVPESTLRDWMKRSQD